MAITKTTQAERFFLRMQGAYLQIDKLFCGPTYYNELGRLIEQYGENIGGGDNTNWQEYYPSFLPAKQQILLMIEHPLPEKGFPKFAKQLREILVMAWSLQLLSPPEGDAVLKEIWETCGKIANQFEIDPLAGLE